MFEEWSYGDGPSGFGWLGLAICGSPGAGLRRSIGRFVVGLASSLCGFGVSQGGEVTLLARNDCSFS